MIETALQHLALPTTIRGRAHQLLRRANAGESQHFLIDTAQMDACADQVITVMTRNYPSLEVPFHSRWRHFEAGGVDRRNQLLQMLQQQPSHVPTDLVLGTSLNDVGTNSTPTLPPFADNDRLEQARVMIDLVVTSVLLDAGSGPAWQYTGMDSNQQPRTYTRSEGLGVASFDAFMAGLFSSKVGSLQADATALIALSDKVLATAFQVSETNPLVGISQRCALLNRLGKCVQDKPTFFSVDADVGTHRVGGLVDYLVAVATAQDRNNRTLPAREILRAVLLSMSDVWPVRLTLGGYSLGDCWRHAAITTDDATSGLVPFHKLSQWLSYSLIEPLEHAGLVITELDELTGLPEYRNGGLFIDAKVMVPKHSDAFERQWLVSDEFVVEWRALTVALLDELAPLIRSKLNRTAIEFPLVKILEGGTWATGRSLAAQARVGGGPPFRITSDGTVF